MIKTAAAIASKIYDQAATLLQRLHCRVKLLEKVALTGTHVQIADLILKQSKAEILGELEVFRRVQGAYGSF